jgi:hypothetical protein
VLVFVFGTILFYLERFSCPYRDQMMKEELEHYDEVCLHDQGYEQSGLALDNVLCCDPTSRALDFGNAAHSCWLAIVTMTTVGYGERYSKTVQGRFFSVVCMFSGIILIALPTAIVGQNFQEVYRNVLDQQRSLKRKSSKQLAIDSMSTLVRKASKSSISPFDSPAAKSSRNPRSASSRSPQSVSWRRMEIISARSNTHKEKLNALQTREQRVQEQLKTDIRNLVQILETHPLRSESVT